MRRGIGTEASSGELSERRARLTVPVCWIWSFTEWRPAFRENRIAVRFAYEWQDDSGCWFRSYGNENWEFDKHGLMRLRIASINDASITESDRKYHWPLGRRPDDHLSLSDL